MPKKRRSVLPVEQIRRKQQQQNRNEGGNGGGLQRRMNAFKHNPPAMLLKDAMAVTFGAGIYYYTPILAIEIFSSDPSRDIAGACNNVNVASVAIVTAGTNKVPGCPNSVASIQPTLPGRPSAAFDFTALGLMAKIIGTTSAEICDESFISSICCVKNHHH